ncbi:hypothetical protein AMECASPLE_015217, partial [Ameca splendens]
ENPRWSSEARCGNRWNPSEWCRDHWDLRRVGPFVCCGLLPQLPAGIAADRKGRQSSDVTVDYIRAPEMPTIAFHAGNRDRLATQLKRIILEKKLTRGFSSVLPTGQKFNEFS